MFKENKVLVRNVSIISIAVIITAWIILNFEGIGAKISLFFTVLTPFYIGFALAYIINKPVKLIEEKVKLPRAVIIIGIYIIIISLLSIFVVALIPNIINSTVQLGEEISQNFSKVTTYLSQVNFGLFEDTIKEVALKLSELMTQVTNFILVNITNALVKTTSTFMNLIFGIIISIYMLLDKEKIQKLLYRLIHLFTTDEQADKIKDAFKEINDVFSHFITGLIVEALVVGLLAFIGFTIMGVKYAQVLALIITFTNVIPYIGPFIGAVPAVLATSLYSPLLALGVLTFIIVLQQIDGNFIGPKIMGNYIGLDPIWIILSITIGGGLFGILGVLLSIPVGALIKLFGSKIIEKYEERPVIKE